ncbi:MAG: carbohydrate-binding protein [Negativicutes bacterium]|nr:carbohydrate-binding protein [Negativicutes bacterium]MDR3590728.1 carbohydrate-binding protein [Negativicutes bacterium]
MSLSKDSNQQYAGNGVALSPAVPAKGETARVVYKGLLADSGADRVYVHVGFGDDWKKTADYRMIRTEQGFEAAIPVTTANTMNLCFKDNANNWDNNAGDNYSFHVH